MLTGTAPIQYIATSDDDVAQLRAEIFRGQLDDSVLCEVMQWSSRTLERAIATGLPHYVRNAQLDTRLDPRVRG